MFKLILFLLFPILLNAQITGIVVDSLKNPIPFANIWVEDLDIGTTTNENGKFEFDSVVKNHFIYLYSIGFEKKRYLVEQNNIEIGLKTKYFKGNSNYILKKKNNQKNWRKKDTKKLRYIFGE